MQRTQDGEAGDHVVRRSAGTPNLPNAVMNDRQRLRRERTCHQNLALLVYCSETEAPSVGYTDCVDGVLLNEEHLIHCLWIRHIRGMGLRRTVDVTRLGRTHMHGTHVAVEVDPCCDRIGHD